MINTTTDTKTQQGGKAPDVPTIRYKFLNGRNSANGNVKWRLNKWEKIQGKIEMCENGFHCSKHTQDALGYVQGDTLAVVEVRGKSIITDDKECWSEMRVIRAIPFSKEHSVKMAIFSARLCLSAFENEYLDDNRPRKAIEAAEKYAKNPTEKNKSAARSAAWSAAESAAWSAARSAAWSAAWSAAYSAASSAANSAAWSVARSAAKKEQVKMIMEEL